MSANALLRRTATLLTATAIAVPALGALGSTAFAAQPTSHGKAAAAKSHGKSAAHASAPSPQQSSKAATPAKTAKPAAAATPAETAKPAEAAKSDPRGNNGTVFIHDLPGDIRPHNVPHVGCTFYVDFFGFDSNQVLSTSFVGQAPTGGGTPLPSGDWTDTMPANGASGAGRDFDAEQAFTLDTSVLGAPQAQQGYHVKLTVSTSEPGGVKHKVFWVSSCAQPTPAVAPQAPAADAPLVKGLRSQRVPQVLGLSVTRQLPAGVTRVLAVSGDRTPSSLPFTGAAGIGMLLTLAAMVLAAGGGLIMAGRRRTAEEISRELTSRC
jgi:hypothetical protein